MQKFKVFISLGFLLLIYSAQNVAAMPKDSPSSTIFADPCYQTIAQAVKTVKTSSEQPLVFKSAELQSETSGERVYLLKFEGLVGAHQLILENDSTNRCFVIQLNYKFK